MQRFILILWLIFPSILFAAPPVCLTALRIQPLLDSTCITFTLTKKTFGHVKYSLNPHRVIIDFENTYKNFQIKQPKLADTNIKSMQAVEKNKQHLQFIFNVTGPVHQSIHFLPGTKGKAVLQLTITSIKSQPIKVLTKKKTVHKEKVSLIETTPRIFTVVIDAGHGGKDPGAKGLLGTQEKDVVLAIAKKLATEINKEPNMRAVLTRKGDYFVPLGERLKLARKGEADLFIAIHADAYFNHSAAGASVYTLSQHGASTVAARWLAQRENHSELDGVELNSLRDQSPMLRSVLIDLAQTTTKQDSIRLGSIVLDALESVSSLHYTHVEHAPFLVLKSPDIPSILVETGFLSNPKEERRLANPYYQTKIARALQQGIVQYVKEYGLM